MNNTTLASGSGAVIAGAVVVVLNHILSRFGIILPPDVITALTVIIYFVGHMVIKGRFPAEPPAINPPKPTPGAL
jgi:hypothetical protein